MECETIKLVLNDVVENFQQEEDEMMIGRIGVEKPWSGKRLKHSTACGPM